MNKDKTIDKKNKLTPDGMGDRLFEECAVETGIAYGLACVFEEAGYRKVRTPGLEFLSVFGSTSSYFPQEEVYKLSDSKGRLVAVRPDSTIPIARLVATKLKGAELPLKLYYAQNVYRRQPEHRGRDSEVMQMGVELIGEAGFSADVDMIDLAVRSLAAVYGGRFRIEIGHVGLYKRLMERLGADEDVCERIQRYVESKNYSALEDALVGFEDRRTAEVILRLPGLFGGAEALAEAAALFKGYDDEACSMVAYLSDVMGELAGRGRAESVMIDLGLVNRAEYYSSLVFKGYGASAGEPLLSGGRYDELFCDFGEEMPATGFGVNIDLLTEAAMGGEGSPADDGLAGGQMENNGNNDRPLRIALAKGRLEEEFVHTLSRWGGYDTAPMEDRGRKLIVFVPEDGGWPERGVEVILAKAPDVVTYVEQGVCDIGIVGKDTLLEHGGTYYEILDLGLGFCKFALAAPAGGAVAGGAAPQVVASKYPQYAGRYFERLGLDVRIIRIEGSVELAPLIGLADSIVDLVQSGATLKENGLEVVSWIRDISARLIVNVTSMKLRKDEIEAFAERVDAPSIIINSESGDA
ncbi:MAG: ATP phosphoribosyltransferase regulatory subunit [Clostridiales bacterium]|nr:ATP phosphoribosyltransferase regulatory subunit [Clostridiales bacterium]